jgi:hypothetical protein
MLTSEPAVPVILIVAPGIAAICIASASMIFLVCAVLVTVYMDMDAAPRRAAITMG